jgi:hypothetical protein
MDRARVPRQAAKQITGHKTDTMYNRYSSVNEQDIQEALIRAKTLLGYKTDNMTS